MKNLVVLSGAGISAESGIKTFRDSNGLWENYRVEEVASPQGWKKNPALVLDFYNQRRKQLHTVHPNTAHKILAELQQFFNVQIITQNIDDLHERAGSAQVLHLHGELLKACSERDKSLILKQKKDIKLGDFAPDGHQLRPYIVWFGEEVPAMEEAVQIARTADIFLVVGTSLQVYPAAGLVHEIPENCELFIINPQESIFSFSKNANFIRENATSGMKKLVDVIMALR